MYVFIRTRQCLLFSLVAKSVGHIDHHQNITTYNLKDSLPVVYVNP